MEIRRRQNRRVSLWTLGGRENRRKRKQGR